MRIIGVSSFDLKQNKRSVTNVHHYHQTPNLNFGASGKNYAKAIESIEMSPKAQSMYKDLIEPAKRITNNDYQLNFLKKLFTTDFCPEHPNPDISGHSIQAFRNMLISINTEENFDAKTHALNFVMKHPKSFGKYSDSSYAHNYSINRFRFIELSNQKYQTDFYDFVDENYTTLAQNPDFLRAIHFMIGMIKTPEQAIVYKDFLSNVMSKYKGDSFNGINLGTYLHAIDNEFSAKYVEDMLPIRENPEERQKFLDWYLINDIKTENQMKIAEQLYDKLYNIDEGKRIELNLTPRTMIAIAHYDDSITTDQLLAIDAEYGRLKSDSEYEGKKYIDRVFAMYKRAQGADEPVVYNEYNRKFLNYIINNETSEFDYKYSEGILNKEFLESIKTQEDLTKGLTLYQTRRNYYSGSLRSSRFIPRMLFQYNVEVADIMNIEKNFISRLSKSYAIPVWWLYKEVANEYLQQLCKPQID